jgi:SAM-dependent methyltransferase
MSGAEKAASHWDGMDEWRRAQPARIRWWESDTIWRVVNRRICGQGITGPNAGLMRLMQSRMRLPLDRAVSVGCGTGLHEIKLIQENIVRSFDLYDISKGSMENGRNYALSIGLGDYCNYSHADAFETAARPIYDLVFWGSSLHHMPDVDLAVKWSLDALKPGGWFVMNEYIGEDRFQWSLRTMACVNFFRALLPEAVFRNEKTPGQQYPRYLKAPTLADMENDPSEAMDSERIVICVKRYFPKATIIDIGGAIYHIGLSDILTNIPEESRTLKWSMAIDRLVSYIVPHYAVAIAQKCP